MINPGAIIPELMRNLAAKPATLNYPFEAVAAPAGFRGTPRFDSSKCVGCQLCVKDCTSEAIEVLLVPPPPAPPVAEGETAPKVPKKYKLVLYLDRCVHCARCAEVCNKDAITLDQDFEIANFTRGAFTIVQE